MSRAPILRIIEDSQRQPIYLELLIPPQLDALGSPEAPTILINPAGKALVVTVFLEDQGIRIQRRPDKFGGYIEEADWRGFIEGIEEISPPLIQVYVYRCGICHKEELYAEDPLLDDFKPYHVHGRHENGNARIYHLRALEPRWMPKSTPMILYTNKVESNAPTGAFKE